MNGRLFFLLAPSLGLATSRSALRASDAGAPLSKIAPGDFVVHYS